MTASTPMFEFQSKVLSFCVLVIVTLSVPSVNVPFAFGSTLSSIQSWPSPSMSAHVGFFGGGGPVHAAEPGPNTESEPGTRIGPWPMSWMQRSASVEPDVSIPPRDEKRIAFYGTESLLPASLTATLSW